MEIVLTTIRKLVKAAIIALLSFALFGCDYNDDVVQGYVEGDYAYISSAVSGSLAQKLVDRGDIVTKDQPLFVLDPEPETSKLNQAKFELARAKQQLINLQKGARATIIEGIEAQLRQAQSALLLTKKTYTRYKSLYRSSAVDKESLDEVRQQYEQSLQKVKEVESSLAEAKLGARENLIKAQKAAVLAARAAKDQAQWALLQKSVRAPVDAKVFDTLYETGEYVKASYPVVVLLAPENIKVVFFVSEKIVSTVAIGNEVVIDCDSCKNSYKAKVSYISPSAEFTPPVIFSQSSRDKLVYRVEAKMSTQYATKFHPGQPVDVFL